MGKRKHNAKGRQVNAVVIDNSETKKVIFLQFSKKKNEILLRLINLLQIKLEINNVEDDYGGYDQSNALVLPSKKRDTKIKKEEQKHVTRILSKKQRKNLEKIVDKKKKKEGVSLYIHLRW